MSNKSGNLAVISSRKSGNKSMRGGHAFFELTLALQTTLDIEGMLEMFSRYLRSFVPHESFGFTNGPLGISLTSGRKSRHSCIYTLMLKEEILGEWQATRSRRFTETEMECIEAFLCRLLHPLRNALTYRRALYFAETDPLTAAGNRSALFAGIQRELEVANRYNMPLSVIFLDVDHFKTINDVHGHDVGDAILRQMAALMKQTVRACDTVFRYGGEEFVVVLPNTAQAGTQTLAERLRQSIEALDCRSGDLTVHVTASLGVATLAPSESHVALLRRADQAMYAAKKGGRNRVAVSAP